MTIVNDLPHDSAEIKSLTNSHMDSHPATKSKMKVFTRISYMIRKNVLILATLVGIVLGFCLGLGLRHADMSDGALMWLGLPGELFLRCLKATIVPLVICMVITSTSTLDPKRNGKIALVATMGFFLTHVIAAVIAIVMFQAFKPDSGPENIKAEEFSTNLQTQDVFADLFRNFFPDNVVGATISQTTTAYSAVREQQTPSNASTNSTEAVVKMVRSTAQTGGINILGLITVCTAVGVAANRNLSPDSEFLRFFRQAQDVIFTVMGWMFWTTPIGVASLIAQSIASVDDIGAVFYALGMLIAAVIVGLAVHQLAVLPAILFVLTRKNPFRFLVRCARPFFIAFAATATSVAMPEMLSSSDRCGIDPSVSAFVIPMSVTLHADGSALYIASAALFLSQTSGQGIGVGDYFVIGTLSSILSLAIPPVPSSSIVTLVIIMTSLNFPLHDVALLFAVEWLLDRCRSGVNAVSHVFVAAFADAICGNDEAKNDGRGYDVRAEYAIGSDHEEDDSDMEKGYHSVKTSTKETKAVEKNHNDIKIDTTRL